MNVSDGMDKSWERSWTTEEMRNKRREWSLAGDAGLLKHLQQFSENLVTRANKTQQAIDSLTTQLNETAIFIDNVTNTSLALANTQFIESRVQEDDIEIEKKVDDLQKGSKEQELSNTDFVASISESIKQGLNIMDENYKRIEVVYSDSEDEEDSRVMSIIWGPNDPYQDRPLPYVIGSEKWKNSNKIGLESSSSESEQVDEEEDESESDNKKERIQVPFESKNGPKEDINRLSFSSSESERSNEAPYTSHGKLDSISQNTMSFASDSTTPINDIPKLANETPQFAEELAKRLGNVRQAQKPPIINETKEPSINKLKDDLFTPEDDAMEEDLFGDKSTNLFDENKGLFEDDVSAKLWKKPSVFQSNIIPPSMDVPPPISTISTKPKSAIDDLFADGDSEDSDDIFTSKQLVKKITKDPSTEKKSPVNMETIENKNLKIPEKSVPVATSTPESNINVNNLFSDEEEDDNDLFGTFKKSSKDEGTQNSVTQDNSKKKPVGGTSILGGILTSGIENTLSNRTPRRQSSGSSSSDTIPNSIVRSMNEPSSEPNLSNIVFGHDQNSIVAGNAGNWNAAVENSGSSGISIQPHSVNSVMSITWTDPQPEYASTRLNSEEVYRERVINDSLFTANTLHPQETVNNSSSFGNIGQSNVEQETESSDDVFENEDLFGPPPLPKTDSKSSKSKIPSLFDDSDSGDDELFSTTSSGSRSQKSTDFLAATPQYPEKNKFTNRRDLFDENVDIFGKKDSPDVDIFGVAPRPSKRNPDIIPDNLSVDKTRGTSVSSVSRDSTTAVKLASVKSTSKEISLFDDDDETEDDLKPEKNDKHSENELFSKPSSEIEFPVNEVKASRCTENFEDKSSNFLSANRRTPLIEEDEDDYDDYEDLFAKSSEKKVGIESKKEKIDESDELDKPKILQEVEAKKYPPTTLNIRAATSSPPDDSQAPRRAAVSGRIKDLMGRMGDLKILSPTDTPPLWRRSEEKTDEEDEPVDRDSDDGGGCFSTQIQAYSTDEKEPPRENVVRSSGNGNSETAISFDVPAQVETLPTAASKSRVRIQAKRRPQSRHARKSALRHSGIDFDTVDAASENVPQDESTDPSKEPSNAVNTLNLPGPNVDRLTLTSSIHSESNPRNTDTNVSIAADDKSELGSISKESSMSANKNTLLSPSTDEEDLFDVPPDLPEDPQKEDLLFGRAPILSPIENVLPDEEATVYNKPLRDTLIGGKERTEPVRCEIVTRTTTNTIAETNLNFDENLMKDSEHTLKRSSSSSDRSDNKDGDGEDTSDVFEEEYSKDQPIDPLRDNTYDPLKDPSSLFAFVTKTPSPDKGKDLLFSDDDSSLFSNSSGRGQTRSEESGRRNLDLFADDANLPADLFSGSLNKPANRNTLKKTRISFFDKNEEESRRREDSEEDSLFGSIGKRIAKSEKSKNQKINIFQDSEDIDADIDDNDANDNLFAEQAIQSEKISKTSLPVDKPVKTSKLSDIFGDQSSTEDDIFASIKQNPKKVVNTKKLFPEDSDDDDDDDDDDNNDNDNDDDDDDDNEIFGKSSSLIESKPNESGGNRPIVKKSVTRDLRKTAEKIVEDPLSIFRDD